MSKVSVKLYAVPGVWKLVLDALLKELKKQWKDLARFWDIAEVLGASTDMATEAGWKLVLADLEGVALHGTPTEANVTPFLRKKKLIPPV